MNIMYGESIVSGIAKGKAPFVVSTMPEVWQMVKDKIGGTSEKVIFVQSMEKLDVERLENSIPEVDFVFGIGGGSAIDFAKYIAWKRKIPLITVPSITSVDAPITKEIALRIDGKVRYIGKVIPEKILIDYCLIKKAPERLNKAGVGDILSSHTALFDWKLAAKRGMENYNEEIARKAEGLLSLLEENVEEIRKITNEGIKLLMQLFLEENKLCWNSGNSRPEEGSEHLFAYNMEYLTRKHFIHGELVCVGIILMSYLQENNPKRALKIIRETGVSIRPKDLGVSREEILNCLLTLPDYVKKENLFYSIVNEVGEDKEKINEAVEFYLSNFEVCQ